MATLPIRQTQEQQRAAQAWNHVGAIKTANFAKKYKSLVKSAPADIQTSGLGQTVAFWRAKGKEEHNALYRHVSDWLKSGSRLKLPMDLHVWIIAPTTSSNDYRLATVEALAYLGWLKRFAEAEIEGEEEAK